MRKKKILGALVCLCLALTAVSSCGQAEKEAAKAAPEDEYPCVVVAIPFEGVAQEDVDLVEEKVSEITERELGISVEFPDFSSSSNYYGDAVKTLSTTEQLDIMLGGFGCFIDSYVDGKVVPLDDLLDAYGQDILEQVGEDKIHCCDIQNVCYGIPLNGDYTQQENCYVMRKDILAKYGIDPASVTSTEALENVFEIVKENEPEMTVLTSAREPKYTILGTLFLLDTTKERIPRSVVSEDGETLVSVFESEQYKQELKRARRWYLKGYIQEDVYGETESVEDRIAAGKVFAYGVKKAAWNEESDEITVGGVEMIRVSLNENVMNHTGYSSMPYFITTNTASAENAMKVLNLFYASAEIENLLCYGVEGVHYQKTADGHFTCADGKDEDPFLAKSYNMPNQYLAGVWEGKPLDYWETVKERNETVAQGEEIGFNFDYSKVEAEYTEVASLYDEYRYVLENGLVNPEQGRQEMVAEMEESGLSLIMEEEQEQYDDWKARQAGGGEE